METKFINIGKSIISLKSFTPYIIFVLTENKSGYLINLS